MGGEKEGVDRDGQFRVKEAAVQNLFHDQEDFVMQISHSLAFPVHIPFSPLSVTRQNAKSTYPRLSEPSMPRSTSVHEQVLLHRNHHAYWLSFYTSHASVVRFALCTRHAASLSLSNRSECTCVMAGQVIHICEVSWLKFALVRDVAVWWYGEIC